MIYLQLFLEFLKIGLFTFGGGYAMIPLVQEIVVKHSWLSESQFTYMIGLCEVTPGPIALNMATFIGTTNAGFLGGLIATIGVIIPSFVIILLVAALLSKFSNNKYVKYALKGTMAVAIGLIIFATITMMLEVLGPINLNKNMSNSTLNLKTIKLFVIIIAYYFLIWILKKKKPGPIQVIFMSAFIGVLVGYIS